MAYNEKIAGRVCEAFGENKEVQEKKMFGGVAFIYKNHMCVGVIDDLLMVRVGPAHYESALSEPYVREMDFTGKPMKGYVYVEPEGFNTEKRLKIWVKRGVSFVNTLPPKQTKK